MNIIVSHRISNSTWGLPIYKGLYPLGFVSKHMDHNMHFSEFAWYCCITRKVFYYAGNNLLL